MPRKVAPSGSPIHIKDLTHWAANHLTRRDCRSTLIQSLQTKFGDSDIYLFNTGRSAMSFLFSCLREQCNDKNRTEIVIPSYTCYSVPSSVIKAGCTVRICDIDVNTLSYISNS
jgi:dTDP-4-amino-4,6-dideoxygalactose transaminase